MVVRIKFKKLNGLEFEDRLSLKEERRGLISVSENLFNEVVRNERDNVMMMLVSRFVRLRYEDLEEVYDDGCKLDEIAKRVGYKNGNTVKSKKDKVLKRMIKMMKEEAGDDAPDLPLVA